MEHWQSEWELFLERKDFPSEEESKREKRLGKPGRNSWIPGKDELDTLSHGITEKEEETNCSVGNPHHHGSGPAGKAGQFASKEDAGSWSLAYHSEKSGCKKGKLKKLGGGRTQWTKAGRCGRDGDYLCSDPKRKKWEEMILTNDIQDDGEFIKIKKIALDRLLGSDEIEDEKEQMLEQNKKQQQIDYCRKLGMKTFNDFLMILNNTRKAEDGKLFDKPKK
jgi:hypothetical protein